MRPSEEQRASSHHTKARILGILCLAAVLRVAFVIPVLDNPPLANTADALDSYIPLAENLTQGYGSHESDLFRIGLRRTPGYPLFVAGVRTLFGNNVLWLLGLQIAASTATVYLVYRLSGLLFKATTAVASALLLALDVASISWTGSVQPEAPFTLLVVAGAYLWLRGTRTFSFRSLFLGGTVLGIATLFRPISLYLPLLFIAAGWLVQRGRTWKQRALTSMAFLVPFGVLVGAWIARNYVVADVPALSTIESENLLEYRGGSTLAEEKGVHYEVARKSLMAEVNRRLKGSTSPAKRVEIERQLAKETVLRHPKAAITSTIKGAFLVAGPARLTVLERFGDGQAKNIQGTGRFLILAFTYLGLTVTYLGALVGTIQLLIKKNLEALFVLLPTPAYIVFLSSGLEGYSRFRVPAMPFLACLAGLGALIAVDVGSFRLRGLTRRKSSLQT